MMQQQTAPSRTVRLRASAIVLVIALLAMVVSAAVGGSIVSAGGSVRTETITFTTDIGVTSHAKLYVPAAATAEDKAPAVLLCHGYTASQDAMEPYAIELSRRGYVVMALDLYGHGETPLPASGYSQAEMGGIADYAPDLGSFSALQQFAQYDFVDLTRVGMVGHSMGTAAIQEGAYLAYAKWNGAYQAALTQALAAGQDETAAAGAAYGAAMSSGVVLPGSLVLTGYNYNTRNGDASSTNYLTYNGVTAENALFPLFAAPVNICTITGAFDEFSGLLWGVSDAAQYTTSFKFAAGTGGASNVPSGTYFLYGDASATPLSRTASVEAAASAALTGQPLRAAYTFDGTHSDTYYDRTAIGYGLDFLDITLRGGAGTLAPEDQMWHGRAACGLIGLLGALTAFVALALTLLRLPFFATLVRPEPRSITTVATKAHGLRYAVIYLLCLLPAPLLYYWLVGYPYYMQPQWFKFLTKVMPSTFFNMAPVNSLALFNLVVGGILLAVYAAIFLLVARKSGCGWAETGLKLPLSQVLKALLLAAVSFGAVYAVLTLCHAFSGTYFSFFKFTLMPMNGAHWLAFFKYLPVWLFFFLLLSTVLNSFTRINHAPAWLNYVLVILASCGGLAVLFGYDYGRLFATGVRGVPYIPGTTSAAWLSAVGISFPTALAGILCFGLLFILPLAAVACRLLFRKTGSAWLGGFLVAFVTLAFTLSHMVINM